MFAYYRDSLLLFGELWLSGSHGGGGFFSGERFISPILMGRRSGWMPNHAHIDRKACSS